MKKILQFVVFVTILHTSIFAQVTIGTGTNQSQQVPMNPYFEFNYTECLYYASEIGTNGTITDIHYYFSGITALPNSQGITVYMGHTTKTSFNSTTDWISSTSLTPVYTGGMDVSGGVGWTKITLTTPFVYNGVDNLVIAFDENMPGFDNASDDFHCTDLSTSRSIYFYSDFTNPNSASPPAADGITSFVPNIMIDIDVCDLPVATASYDCTSDAVIVNVSNTGTPVGSYTATIDGAGTGQAITATGNYTFTGLTPDQTYTAVLDDGSGCVTDIPYIYGDCFSLDVGCVSMWPAGDFESGDSNWNENGAVGGGAGVNVANTLIVPTTPLAGVKSARFGGFGGTNPVSAVPPFTSTLVESFFAAIGSTYTLRFWILVDACDSASDLFEISVDGTVEYALTGGEVTCGDSKWREITLDLSTYADDTPHTVNFQLVENETNGGATSIFIDEMVMEECTPITCPAIYLIPTTVNPGSPAYNGGFVSAGLWDFETDGTIVSIQKITTGNTVDYDSKMSIELGALDGSIYGFEVELGATFHAFIDGCNGTGGTVNPLGEDNAAALSVDGEQSTVVKVEKKDLDKK